MFSINTTANTEPLILSVAFQLHVQLLYTNKNGIMSGLISIMCTVMGHIGVISENQVNR